MTIRGDVQTMRGALAFLCLVGSLPAALKPVTADLQLLDNQAVTPYKTTPQGDLKMNLYFPPGWKKTDQRPAIVLFFGGSCATGNPSQFASTAEYFAKRGLVSSSAEYRIDRKSTRLNSSHGYTSHAVFCLTKRTPAGSCFSCARRSSIHPRAAPFSGAP